MAPTGRIRAPSQNTPKVLSSAAVSFSAGKNALAMALAEKPNRKKSNCSRKLPLVARRMAPMRDLICGTSGAADGDMTGFSLSTIVVVRQSATPARHDQMEIGIGTESL